MFLYLLIKKQKRHSDYTVFEKMNTDTTIVRLRNNIGHGAVITPPSNDSFKDLFEYTENLVENYCRVFSEWIHTQFSEEAGDDFPATTA